MIYSYSVSGLKTEAVLQQNSAFPHVDPCRRLNKETAFLLYFDVTLVNPGVIIMKFKSPLCLVTVAKLQIAVQGRGQLYKYYLMSYYVYMALKAVRCKSSPNREGHSSSSGLEWLFQNLDLVCLCFNVPVAEVVDAFFCLLL